MSQQDQEKTLKLSLMYRIMINLLFLMAFNLYSIASSQFGVRTLGNQTFCDLPSTGCSVLQKCYRYLDADIKSVPGWVATNSWSIDLFWTWAAAAASAATAARAASAVMAVDGSRWLARPRRAPLVMDFVSNAGWSNLPTSQFPKLGEKQPLCQKIT